MKFELILFGITGFILYNMYYDNKYLKMLINYKKYYQMIFILLLSICIYVMFKKNPRECHKLLLHTNDFIKYAPIDKTTMNMLNPIIDLTTRGRNNIMNESSILTSNDRYISVNNKPTKRSVSETKKKYVASEQDWKCGKCKNKLNHTFEIDHKIRLEYGGTNDPSNLIALCRECHGKKTAMENM